jgi:lysophospholipid acyltransferase (LPLAT)-like uncharacterized protein
MLKTPLGKKILIAVVPRLVYYLLKVILLTCRKRYVIDEHLDGRQFVYVSWHGELVTFPYFYKKIIKPMSQDDRMSAIVSQHTDGELIAQFLSLYGFKSIRGSSSKGGVKSLVNAIKDAKSGSNLGVTPDGPKGPRHSVADGVAAIASKSGVDIMCFNYNATSYWQSQKSWDKFAIPKPFSTVTFYTKFISVEDLSVEEIKDKVKKELMKHAI